MKKLPLRILRPAARLAAADFAALFFARVPREKTGGLERYSTAKQLFSQIADIKGRMGQPKLPRISGFFTPPEITWGAGEFPVTNQDFQGCGLEPPTEYQYFTQAKELVKRVESGQCLQLKQEKHQLHANAAFAELWLKEKLWEVFICFWRQGPLFGCESYFKGVQSIEGRAF